MVPGRLELDRMLEARPSVTAFCTNLNSLAGSSAASSVSGWGNSLNRRSVTGSTISCSEVSSDAQIFSSRPASVPILARTQAWSLTAAIAARTSAELATAWMLASTMSYSSAGNNLCTYSLHSAGEEV